MVIDTFPLAILAQVALTKLGRAAMVQLYTLTTTVLEAEQPWVSVTVTV